MDDIPDCQIRVACDGKQALGEVDGMFACRFCKLELYRGLPWEHTFDDVEGS